VREHDQWVPAMVGRTDWIDPFSERLALFGHREFVTDSAVIRAAPPAAGVTAASRLRHAERYIAYFGPRAFEEVAKLLPRREPGKGPVGSGQRVLAGKPRVILIDAKAISPIANVDLLFGIHAMNDPTRLAEVEEFVQYWSWDLHPLADRLRGATRFEVHPNYPQQHLDDGWMAIRIKTTPAEALDAIGHTVTDVLATPLDPAILARAKESRDEAIRTSWIARMDVPARVLGWRMAGRSASVDPRQENRARWATVGMPELQSFTTELARASRVILIWGNLDGLQRDALAKRYGAIEEMTLQQVLGLASPDIKKPATKAGSHRTGKRR